MPNRLAFRLVVPSLAISLLVLIIAGFSAIYVVRQQTEASELLSHSARHLHTAERIVDACRSIRFNVGQYSGRGSEHSLRRIGENLDDLPVLLNRGEILATTDSERALLETIQRGVAQFPAELEVLTQLPPDEREERGRGVTVDLVAETMLDPARRYLADGELAIARSSQQSQAMAEKVALWLALLGICGAVAGLATGYAISSSVRHTLIRLHLPIQTATGKLEEVVGPIEVREPRDLRDLDAILENLADRVSSVVDRLQQSRLELLRAEQLAALGQLAAGLAHELRNPLMSIKILVQTAVEEGEVAKLEGRDVAVLAEELERLEESIQRFLDFAKPPTLTKHVFDLREVMRRILDLVSAKAAQQNTELDCDMPETPIEIRADREQIRQLLLNVILNGLDAVKSGGKVTMRLTLADEASPEAPDSIQPWVTVVVHDSGPGVPHDLANRIFDPFVSTKETGLGLGLAICRQIAKAHNGEIQVTNGDGGGAEFTVRLPATKPLAPARNESN